MSARNVHADSRLQQVVVTRLLWRVDSRARLALIIGIAVTCGWCAATRHTFRDSDFAPSVHAAELWLAGGDPYSVTHGGRFPMFYPLTAVLVALPFSFLPSADFAFVAVSIGLFLWAVTAETRFRWAALVLLTPSGIQMILMSQWSALSTAAALLPSLGFLLACKPTIGGALWCAFPSKRALFGVAMFLVVSLILLPDWPWRWVRTFGAASHMHAPVTFWGGPLLLLALLRWRCWEARLLVALACVPQSQFFYDLWPLFLIPATGAEAALLFAGIWAVFFGMPSPATPPNEHAYLPERQVLGQLAVLFVYLPCLLMVLRRPLVWTPAGSREVVPARS